VARVAPAALVAPPVDLDQRLTEHGDKGGAGSVLQTTRCGSGGSCGMRAALNHALLKE
jgi:hypothetical protein